MDRSSLPVAIYLHIHSGTRDHTEEFAPAEIKKGKVYSCCSRVVFDHRLTKIIVAALMLSLFRACLIYGREVSLVGGLPSPKSRLLPSVYMRMLSLLTEPKRGSLGSKDMKRLAKVDLKHLLWRPFAKIRNTETSTNTFLEL